MRQNEEIVNKLRHYQYKIYGGENMVLKDITFECGRCKIHFTPSEYRAKNLMRDKGVINECEKCEKGTSDVY
tara:strand:+ start:615 stop:830 length:216 start_codon:yes stop_codon:yes gene_type:complete